ncbi:MAG: hypothetical protein M3024_00305 [Candidatus Dormibacteraeota bacterium]|nr:hypothetical protein [Candidatus Dormibacteraeota bacterium]
MKLLRAALLFAGLVAALVPAAGRAAGPEVTLSVSPRWNATQPQGAWNPYVVTVRNSSGVEVAGDVTLEPLASYIDQPVDLPAHRLHVAVPRGSQRQSVVYLLDAAAGYRARLRDSGGRILAEAASTVSSRASTVIGVLSDLPQADQKISAVLGTSSAVRLIASHFGSIAAFPANAVQLTGLHGVVIDQLDSAALSQAQLQALHDFVGLGGFLVEVGGPSWRRTLLPLPADLVPMLPGALNSEPVTALTDLAGIVADPLAVTQVASGPVGAGTVALAAADGTPLVVEAAMGAGRIVELGFDPLADPFAARPSLAALAWSVAVVRALSGVQGPEAQGVGGLGLAPSVSLPGRPQGPVAGPGEWVPVSNLSGAEPYRLLGDTGPSAVPPIGIVGGLLVFYVLLAGGLNYLFLRAARRRELMWVTVPLTAILFTGLAYGVGVAGRGAGYQVSEIQISRLAPGGAVETYTFASVHSPRRGDVSVTGPRGALTSSGVGAAGAGSGQALVVDGAGPFVLLQQVPIWTPRAVESLSVTRAAGEGAGGPALESHLRLQNGRLQGTVANRGQETLRAVTLFGSSSNRIPIAPRLRPGQTARVDAAFAPGFQSQYGSEAVGVMPGSSAEDAVLRLAASQSLGARAGDLALTALAPTSQPLRVAGTPPEVSGLAAVVLPVTLESADALTASAAQGRLVSAVDPDGSGVYQDVYDLTVPRGVTAPVGLVYSLIDTGSANAPARSAGVYDWPSRTWVPLPVQSQNASSRAQPLTAGETAGGVVRVRVAEDGPGDAQVGLTAP